MFETIQRARATLAIETGRDKSAVTESEALARLGGSWKLRPKKRTDRFPWNLLDVSAYYEREYSRPLERFNRAVRLIEIACRLALKLDRPAESLKKARAARRDGGPELTASELEGEIRRVRSELERARIVYGMLADGADVDPLPDTCRGARNELKKMLQEDLRWWKAQAKCNPESDAR
ncbi:MAG: hypothetical protein JW940_00465 [Polyangiaceae bacterium]|nr:hypothetical protein [Polyangiaceae bacterium]